MLYTSGTTGRPKGVPRSHRAERAAALAQLVQLELRPGDRTLGVMPLYHTMGMRSLLAASACGGALLQPARVPRRRRAGRRRARAPDLAVPRADALPRPRRRAARAAARRLQRARAGLRRRARWRACSSSAASRPSRPRPSSTTTARPRSTRSRSTATSAPSRAAPAAPALNARIRLVEPVEGASPDDVVAPGEVGQVACALSSDEAFAGYWKRPDADARQIRDGWYFPGDLGQLDADGDLYLVGRIDDMIVSGGENVHPLEIEEWLVRHPGVDEAAVVGEAGRAPRPARRRLRRAAPARSRRTRSTRTAWPRRRSRASSAHATTVSSTRCRRARRASSCAACCARPREPHDRVRRLPPRARERPGRRDDHARRARQAQPRQHGRARRARAGVRASSAATTPCASSCCAAPATRPSPRAATSACSWSATPRRSRTCTSTSARPSAARSP